MILFLGGLLSGLAGAGLSALGSAGQRKHDRRMAHAQGMFNLGMAEKENEWNKENWERQKSFAIDMWNRQNQYNSPAEQMKRFQEAGLNPHLIYGQGSSGNASTAPQATLANAAEVKGYDRHQSQNIMKGFEHFGSTFAQFRNLNTQRDLVQAQADKERQLTQNAKADQLFRLYHLQRDKRFEPYQLRQLNFQTQALEASINKTNLESDKLFQEVEQIKEQRPLLADKLSAEAQAIRQQMRESLSRINLNNEKKAESQLQQALMEMDKAIKAANVKLAKEGIRLEDGLLPKFLGHAGVFRGVAAIRDAIEGGYNSGLKYLKGDNPLKNFPFTIERKYNKR